MTDKEQKQDAIRKTAAAILKSRPSYENILDFYLRIFLLQEESLVNVEIEQIRIDKTDKKLPLIEPADFRIDLKESESFLKKLGGIGGNETLAAAFPKIAEAVENGRPNSAEFFSIPALAENQAFYKEIGESLEIDPAIPGFAAYVSVKPSVTLCVERLSEHLDENLEYGGCCPICSGPPSFSLLKNEGKRSLVCGFCDHEWPAKRLFCPFCENTSQSRLSYMYHDEESHHRIDICEKCRKYLKTADIRKIPHMFHPGLEQVSTLHLDMIARKKGYESGPGSFLGPA